MFMTMAIRTVLIYSLPFFIYCMFNGYAPELYGKFFVMGVLVDLASSFIPLPGGTGMNEVSFMAIFAPYFTGGSIFWAMLLWRFFTYYLYLILGFGMITYDVAYVLNNCAGLYTLPLTTGGRHFVFFATTRPYLG